MTEMTEATGTITVDELRNKALRVKDMAESEVRHVAEQRISTAVIVGVVAVVSAVTLAYYMGTRRR